MLGIVDRVLAKNSPYSHGKNYALYYYCSTGKVFPESMGIKGEKAKNGEIVQVVVELSKGRIEFHINSFDKKSKLIVSNTILKEDNRLFVPSIEMFYSNE
jgi:hypothetical protein